MPIDENDLRAGMRALTAAPPAQPADRAESSVRRAGAIRRKRAAAVSLAVLLPAAGVGAWALAPAQERGFTPVAEWPDGRDPALVDTSENALAEWLDRSDTDLGPDRRVRWLFARHVPAGGDDVVVAFALCGDAGCHEIVSMRGADDGGVPDGDPSSSRWLMMSRPLDPAAPPPPLATYLDGPRGDRGPTNAVFVLAGPDAARVTWESPGRLPGSGGAGDLPAIGGGAFVGDVGYLTAQATVTVYDRDGTVLHRGPAGEDGQVPNAPWLEGDLDPGPGYDIHSGNSGQLRDEENHHDETIDTPYALFVRCVADAPLTLTIDSAPPLRAPCDGKTRRLTPVRPAPRTALIYSLETTDPYTVYQLGIAAPR